MRERCHYLVLEPGAVGRLLAAVGFVLLGAALVAAPLSAQRRSFRLEGLRSGELEPGDLQQGAVIVIVWTSWSPRSRDIVERSNAIVDRWGKRARVLTVSFQEDRETVERFLEGKRPRARVYLDPDGDFGKSYVVTQLPGLLIFKDGVTAFSGRLPRDPDSLIEQTLG